MPYTNAHLLVRVHGGFGASGAALSDRWSSGFRVGIPTQDVSFNPAALQTFANSVHTAAATFHSNAGTRAGVTCFMTHVTVARVGENGLYDPAGQLTVVSTGAVAQGSQAAFLPWNTALSYGLRTAAPRGPASNGRFYYPMLAATLTANTGRVDPTQVTTRLNQFRTFLNAVNTAALVYEPATGVQVMSNVGFGKSERVLSIRSDDRLDSIERRENGLPSNYQVLAL